jgi:hypothetical protein
MLRWNISSPSSGSKNKPNKKPAGADGKQKTAREKSDLIGLAYNRHDFPYVLVYSSNREDEINVPPKLRALYVLQGVTTQKTVLFKES